jgi:hypothetical protein
MPERRHLKQSSTLEFRLTQEAFNLRKQAQGMPEGVRRDELLRKAEQMMPLYTGGFRIPAYPPQLNKWSSGAADCFRPRRA